MKTNYFPRLGILWVLLLVLFGGSVYGQCSCSEGELAPNGDRLQCEDFNAYNFGPLTPQSPNWRLWAPGADDGVIGTIPPIISLHVLTMQRTATSDPDILYQLGDRTSGRYRLSWLMRVEPGKAGYYNMQYAQAGSSWAYHVYFNSNGTGRLRLGNQSESASAAAFSYSQGAWTQVMQIIDLDADVAELWINGNFVHSWTYSLGSANKKLGAVNFYAGDNNFYYVDNICLWRKKTSCLCPLIYAPVCVKNGKTYSNSCVAGCDLYISSEWTDGVCQGDFCSKAVNVQCGQLLTGQTTSGAGNDLNAFNYRGCLTTTKVYSGPDKVYKVTVPAGTTLQIELQDMSADLDLFLLDDNCQVASCLAYSALTGAANNERIVYPNASGVYYIVVDGANGVAGTFKLKIGCERPEDCACYEEADNLPGDLRLCESFDSYNPGPVTPQAPTRWKLRTAGTGDANVAARPLGTGYALKVEPPSDLLLLLGNRTTGRYRLSWLMYVSAGKGGFYNVQHWENQANVAYQVNFQSNGSGSLRLGDQPTGATAATFTYTNGGWNRVMQIIDLVKDTAELWINDNFVHAWPFSKGSIAPLKQLGAVSFYANVGDQYYVDNICLLQTKSNCVTTAEINYVCVKNGKTYVNPGSARCDLYRQAEWAPGTCCPSPPQEDYACGVTFRYSGTQGTDLTYTFTSGGKPIAPGQTWRIDGQAITGATGTTFSYTFPRPGRYKICFPYQQEGGCLKYCCIYVCVENPYDNCPFDYDYVPANNAFRFRMPVGEYSDISWQVVDGAELGAGQNSGLLALSGACRPVVVCVRYYDRFARCWVIKYRRVYLCNPLECFDIVPYYVSTGEQPGYQFTLNATDIDPASVRWQVSETAMSLGSGSSRSTILPAPSVCVKYHIIVRYYDRSCQCWRICWYPIWVCNPFECYYPISYRFNPARNVYEFTLEGEGAFSSIEWTVDNLNLRLGTGRTVTWQTSECGVYAITARYYDPSCRCWRYCCRWIYICPPFNCQETISYRYAEGKLQLSVNQAYSEVKWTDATNNRDIGAGNSVSYTFPGGVIQVCVAFYDPQTKAYRTCCRTISTGPALPNLTTAGTPAAMVNGTRVTVSTAVVNNGNSVAGPGVLIYYLSPDTTISGADYEIGASNINGLVINQQQAASLMTDVATLLVPVPPGTYYLGYCIDAGNQVPESNELDNCYLFRNVRVTVPPPVQPILEIRPATVQVGPDSGKVAVNVISNIDWVATETAPWLRVSPTRGFGNLPLDLFYSANRDTVPRNTLVTVSGGGLTRTLQVTQEGAATANRPVIDIDDNVCGGAGQTISVPLRVRRFKNIASAQFTVLSSNASVAVFKKPLEDGKPGYNFNLVNDTTLAVLWTSVSGQPVSFADDSVFITLRVELRGSTGQATVITFNDSPTPLEVIQVTPGGIIVAETDTYDGSVCIRPNTFSIGGRVLREDNVGVGKTTVTLSGGLARSTVTDAQGNYLFTGLPGGLNYLITPEKNINARNGLTGGDLFLIQRHILGLQPLPTPYRVIAADANKSKTVTGGDLFILQRLILALDTSFTQNKSWRFVQRSYTFPNPANPFNPDFPEAIPVLSLSADLSNADFTGIKTGDVLISNNPANLQEEEVEPRDWPEKLDMRVSERILGANEPLEVVFTAANALELGGYQFTLELKEEWMSLLDIIPGQLPGMSGNHFGRFASAVTTVWTDPAGRGITLEPGTELFRLRLALRPEAEGRRLSEAIRLSSRLTPAGAFAPDLHPQGVALSFTETTGQRLLSHRVFPNPTDGQATLEIGFSGESQAADILIRDQLGRLLTLIRTDLREGINRIALELGAVAPSGLLYYQVRIAGEQVTGKIARMD